MSGILRPDEDRGDDCSHCDGMLRWCSSSAASVSTLVLPARLRLASSCSLAAADAAAAAFIRSSAVTTPPVFVVVHDDVEEALGKQYSRVVIVVVQVVLHEATSQVKK